MARNPPRAASWVASLHKSEDDFAPLGTALVIDQRRVLTSAHVVHDGKGVRDEVWVALPMCDDPQAGRRITSIILLAGHPLADLAVVEFAEPIPIGVEPAPLRCPKPADLVGRDWWALATHARTRTETRPTATSGRR